MVDTTKLSVGKTLDKLRRSNEPRVSRTTQLQEKADALAEETRRLRATRLRLERDQQAGGKKA